jgi:hypothetical protein
MAARSYSDTPNQIKFEGQEIDVKFIKTSATTGKIEWNIPTPPDGCDASQQAYNGIILTLNTKEVTTEQKPVPGTRYNADPTGDPNLHVGDKIETALVVGAFYDDKTTTSLIVTDLDATGTYYVSGYAHDAQNRYHTEGTHAYALTVGVGDIVPETAGYQAIGLGAGHQPTDPTNLVPTQTYSFDINIDGKPPKTITILGSDAQTWGDLVTELNKQLALTETPTQSNVAPLTGVYYWDEPNQQLQQFDGTIYNDKPFLNETTDPASPPVIGDYWYNTPDLKVWDGAAWQPSTYVPYIKSPDDITCGDFWKSPTHVYKFDGIVWCETPSYSQEIDPALASNPLCGTYWYSPVTQVVHKWGDVNNTWLPVNPIYSAIAPDATTLPAGELFYNDATKKLFEWTLPVLPATEGTWTTLPVRVCKKKPTTNLVDGVYWYDYINNLFEKFDLTANTWNPVTVGLIYNTFPTDRNSCDLWWDKTTDVLNTWDDANSVWVPVPNFLQTETDPSSLPGLKVGTTWHQPSSKNVWEWDSSQWNLVDFVEQPTDPRVRIDGEIFFNTTTKSWDKWDAAGNAWIPLNPNIIESTQDPTALIPGTLWVDPLTKTLNQWDGVVWTPLAMPLQKTFPQVGDLWFDVSVNVLKEWNGSGWKPAVPPATGVLDDDGTITFTSGELGSDSSISINNNTDTLFPAVTTPAGNNPIYGTPQAGVDPVSSVPTYQQVGAGTDGNPEIRRELIDSIRQQLGYPTVDVELTRQQFDYCIDSSIEELRKRTSVAYEQGYFFLNLQAGVQHYTLSNKPAGFDKIVEIVKIYRGNVGSINSAFFADNGYGDYMYAGAGINGTGGYDMVTHQLHSGYVAELERVFDRDLTFQWKEYTKRLSFFKSIRRNETVMIEASVERTEQELMQDRYLKSWIEEWAQASAMNLLSQIRGKYASLPGAGGGVLLNAGDLYQQSVEAKDYLLRQIDDYIVERPEEWGYGVPFVLG